MGEEGGRGGAKRGGAAFAPGFLVPLWAAASLWMVPSSPSEGCRAELGRCAMPEPTASPGEGCSSAPCTTSP